MQWNAFWETVTSPQGLSKNESRRQQKEQISLSAVQCWMYDSYCFNQSQFNRQQPRENLWGVMKADRWKLTAIIKDCASTPSFHSDVRDQCKKCGDTHIRMGHSMATEPKMVACTGDLWKTGLELLKSVLTHHSQIRHSFAIVNMYVCKTQDGSSMRTHTWRHVGAGLTALFSIFTLREPGEQLLGWIRVSGTSTFLFAQIIHYERNGWVNIWSNNLW